MEDSEMRTSCPGFRLLLLMALCTLFAATAVLAQAPQPTAAPQTVPTVSEFLATLSDNPGDVPGTGNLLPPSPKNLSTICHSNSDCGPHELCCYPCGIPDCNFVCMRVKRCPLIP